MACAGQARAEGKSSPPGGAEGLLLRGGHGLPVQVEVLQSGVRLSRGAESPHGHAAQRGQALPSVVCTDAHPGAQSFLQPESSGRFCKRRRAARSQVPCGSLVDLASGDRLLKKEDLLGAVLDDESGLLRLVHCPPVGDDAARGRCRSDVILQVDDPADSALMQRARDWASNASGRLCSVSSARRFLVFVNPVSGSGRAADAWGVADKLWSDLPWITSTVVTTTHAGHARNQVAEIDLEPYTGIVVVSGDGLIHEVLNGLASRPDAERALRIPVGHIPGGSGNTLAKNVTFLAGERLDAMGAAFAIAKGDRRRIGLMDAVTPGKPVKTSFLSLSGALISDADIESECLRCLGGARFTVFAALRVIWPRLVDVKLCYWPADADANPQPGAPPPSEGPLPPGPWRTLDDSLMAFWGCSAPWACYDAHLAPGKDLSDGTWSIVVLRRVSRLRLARFLLALESGTHLESGDAELIRCQAFRLTPRSARGHLSLDGEEVPFGPIQVWPSPHNGWILG